jgi:redox-sensitive bicupin YhaK (pirin superfamily)
MSGPVVGEDQAGIPAEETTGTSGPRAVEITDGRAQTVGAIPVRRTLPIRSRRTVGAWCFVDHLGPLAVAPDASQGGARGVDVGPHPHTGLHTVTWLLAGEVRHLDSLGSEQVIRPGQLNLMTAGHGVVHAEEGTDYRGPLHGAQLWVAQPEATRDGPAAFEHHAEVPVAEVGGPGGLAVAAVLLGEFAGVTSPARRDTELTGVDLDLRPGRAVLPLRPGFEYALVVLEGAVKVAGGPVARPGQLAYLGLGRDELALDVAEPARALLLGGLPFPEPVLMWWNFVARTRAELTAAVEQWAGHDERFGPVASALDRIPAPPPPWR